MRRPTEAPYASGSYGRLHLRLAECLEHRGEDADAVPPRLGGLHLGLLVVDEAFGQRHRTDLQALVEDAFPGAELHDLRGEDADGAFLHRTQPFSRTRPPAPTPNTG